MKRLDELITKLLDYKKRRILAMLKLERIPKKIPSIKSLDFKIAAQDAMKKQAKKSFMKLVQKYEKIVFPSYLTPEEKINRFASKLRSIRKKDIKRLIYVYWGYKDNKRMRIYVGKTKGKGSRANQHRRFFRKYNITMIQLYRVKGGEKYLDAAECIGIHAYAPLGQRYPPANKRRGDCKKRRYHCRVCKYIRKSWKITKRLRK